MLVEEWLNLLMDLKDLIDGVNITYVLSWDLTSSCNKLTSWIKVYSFMVDLSSRNWNLQVRKLSLRFLSSNKKPHLLELTITRVTLTPLTNNLVQSNNNTRLLNLPHPLTHNTTAVLGVVLERLLLSSLVKRKLKLKLEMCVKETKW